MAINLKGVWLCMREALRHMQPQGKGCIINMASALSLTTYPHTGLYTASKHAVAGLTKSTAVEYGEMGIRINAICPGFISTPLLHSTVSDDVAELMAGKHPMNRLGRARGSRMQWPIWRQMPPLLLPARCSLLTAGGPQAERPDTGSQAAAVSIHADGNHAFHHLHVIGGQRDPG